MWIFGAYVVGFLHGALTRQSAPKPATRFVVVRNGQYMTSWADSFSEWTENPADAFPFSTYDIAEAAALGVGGRVQEYTV